MRLSLSFAVSPELLLRAVAGTRRLLPFALAILAGCTASSTRIDTATVDRYAAQGYVSEERHPLVHSAQQWRYGEHEITGRLSVPARPGRYPLIIYLPGLGESAEAGEVWRHAWAQAGYAVLALALLPDDVHAWGTDAARRGDFAAVATARMAAAPHRLRGDALHYVVTAVRREAAAAQGDWAKVDTERLAVAGYDLGATAALVASGERFGDSDQAAAAPAPLGAKATLAISPNPGRSRLANSLRYGGIQGPVLTITSHADLDPYGLVASAVARRAPFDFMPAGGKYLLMLNDATHAQLGGGMPVVPPPEAQRRERPMARDEEGGTGRGRGGSGGGAGRGGSGRDQPEGAGRGRSSSDDGFGGGAAFEHAEPPPQRQTGPSPTTTGLRRAAIQGVSIAFFDAYVKNDPLAISWLQQRAPAWLGRDAQLLVR